MVRDYNFTEEEVELIKASMEVHTNEEQEYHQNNDNNSYNNNNNNNNDGGDVIGGGLCLKVMTDEQMEVLRKQISVYATICEQLVQMHKSISAQQDFSGVGLGNLYCDSLITYAGNKNMTRHRWTPTPVQLQILERVFSQGIGTPSKQKIKDLTIELSRHGQISETNVYNWFQNRRARSKRKQFAEAPHNSDAEKTESAEKNMKPAEITNISVNTTSDSRCKGKLSFSPDHDLRLHGSYGRESAVYENVPGSSDLMDNVEQPKNFGP